MFSKILVPLDGSSLALRILNPLERLLRASPTEVTLLRVVEPRNAVDHDQLPAAELDLKAQLREVQEVIGPGTQVHTIVVRGDPADQIVRYAADTGQELVAMSTHGRTGVDRVVRGSVAERVLRSCEVPVLLCSPLAFASRHAAQFATILVPLDGSERAERVLPFVQRIATAHDSQVKLLRVEPLVVSELPSPILTGSLWDPQPLEQSLRPAVDRLESAGLKADACAAYGVVAAEVLRASEGVDLLAMTTHGRSGLSRWWFGSVAETVLRQARCPLLVVRTPD